MRDQTKTLPCIGREIVSKVLHGDFTVEGEFSWQHTLLLAAHRRVPSVATVTLETLTSSSGISS